MTEFYKQKSHSTGHTYRCKLCDRQSKWRTLNGDGARWRLGQFSPVEPRFWPKVKMCEHGRNCVDCCWPWQGGRVGPAGPDKGYGVIYDHGKQRRAAKVAWEFLYEKPWPTKKMQCHNCNNPPCVNGYHVYPGTGSDNMQDRKRAGNQPRGYKRRPLDNAG